MPGFVTHYLFGCKSIRGISNIQLKEIIKINKKAYAIGLQGPDIFFYDPFSFTMSRKRLGSVMHVYETGNFLINLAHEVSKLSGNDRNIGIAYLSGFLGHYSLDTVCHPYIYYATGYLDKNESYIGKHVDFETDIDKLLLERMENTDVLDFRQDKTIKLTNRQRKIIASLLNSACKRTYPEIVSSQLLMEHALVNFRIVNSMLKDPYGWKNKIVTTTENIVIGHPAVSPLLVIGNKKSRWRDPLNDMKQVWYNPWDMTFEHNDTFEELMNKAKQRYLEILDWICLLYFQNMDTDLEYIKLKNIVENNSYHSGLDCSIPS